MYACSQEFMRCRPGRRRPIQLLTTVGGRVVTSEAQQVRAGHGRALAFECELPTASPHSPARFSLILCNFETTTLLVPNANRTLHKLHNSRIGKPSEKVDGVHVREDRTHSCVAVEKGRKGLEGFLRESTPLDPTEVSGPQSRIPMYASSHISFQIPVIVHKT